MRATGLLILALLVQSVAMLAQAPPREAVDRKVKPKSVAAAAQDAATASSPGAEAQCGADAVSQSCRLLANYSLGYTAQQKGDLAQARGYYQRVLAEAPTNGATLNNLALVEDAAGNNSAAEDLWNRAITADPEQAGQWALQLGDHDLRRKQYDAAFKAYQLAADKLPNAETPRRRIVASYVRLPDNTLDQLATQAFGWETAFPSTARSAYELLITRSYSGPSSDEVLRRWVALVSRLDDWTKSTLRIVPAGWKSSAVGELRAYLENPTAPFHWSWWRQNPARISTTLEMASAVGREMLQETHDASRTAACWEGALDSTNDYFSLQQLKIADGTTGLTVFLDLNQNLTSLYYHYPSLDKDGKKLDGVIRRLFEQKGFFIDKEDWEATQNYHTTLAALYVDRGIWDPKPGTSYAAGAIFQLRAALQDADRRYRASGQKFFQPLPELKEKLAEGYARTNQSQLAATEYVNATAAYMDVDALDAAQKSLTKAQELKAPADATGQLAHILETRQKLLQGAPVEVSPDKTPWLYQPAGPIDKQFLNRQTFKISVDSAISQGAAEGPNQDLAIKAYQMATEQQTPLVGGGDLVRWRKLEAQLRTKTNTPVAQKPTAAVSQTKVPDKGLSLTMPGNWRATQVAIDPQLSRAVQSMATGVKK